MTFHSNRPERPQMPERTKRVYNYSQGNASLPYRRNRLEPAGTSPATNTLWEHVVSQQQLVQPGHLDQFNYFDAGAPGSTISESQFSVNDIDGHIGVNAPASSLISDEILDLELSFSQYMDPKDGFISHSSPESAAWQPGEVFTPNSSYMGSQSGDSLLPDGQPRSYGSFDSITSSTPETLASGFSENLNVLDTSPTWGSPLSNGRLLEDLNMPNGYFETVPRSPHSFADEAYEPSKEVLSEATYAAEPISCDAFEDFTARESGNWMMVDSVYTQFCVQDLPEPSHPVHIPWSPEHPQHGSGAHAGNSAFQPKPGYSHDMFKYREGLFRASHPVLPYFGPQGSFLVRENSNGQSQPIHENEILSRPYENQSSQEPLDLHEHVFSVVNGTRTPENNRKRKLTDAERERRLEVRKDGACWACHLLKTKCSPCSSGSPCEQCTRLVGKRRFCLLPCFNDPIETLYIFIVPDSLFGHFTEANVEAFIGKHAIGWGTKTFPLQMSWGCRKLLDVNVATLSLLDDSSELAYNHQAIASENGSVEFIRKKCAPLGINMADIGDMRKKYRCHVEDVVKEDLLHYVSIAYDDQSSKLPERLLEAVCLWYQRGSGNDEERVLLRQAIEVHVASTILERSLIVDKACISNVQAHLGQEYPNFSAPRGAQRQIKLAIFLEQRPRIIRVLKQWGKLMRSTARAEKNWPTAFCVFLTMILTMDKMIAAAQNFCEGRIKFRGRDAKFERETFENLRMVMETSLFERCKEIFHCRYKTRKGGNERCNPVRDGTAAWRSDTAENRTARLIDDIQQVIRDFVPNRARADQRPACTGQVMYTDLGRLAKIFLGEF